MCLSLAQPFRSLSKPFSSVLHTPYLALHSHHPNHQHAAAHAIDLISSSPPLQPASPLGVPRTTSTPLLLRSCEAVMNLYNRAAQSSPQVSLLVSLSSFLFVSVLLSFCLFAEPFHALLGLPQFRLLRKHERNTPSPRWRAGGEARVLLQVLQRPAMPRPGSQGEHFLSLSSCGLPQGCEL